MKTKTICAQVKASLWKLFLRVAGDLVSRAEDWIHAQEIKLRAPITAPVATAASDGFQIAPSRARERAIKKARPARLRYQGGQFVRERGL